MKLINPCSRLHRFFHVALLSVAVTGCVSAPIEPAQPPSEISVAQARATLVEGESPLTSIDEQILWGGVILRTENLADATQVEILGYPLDSRQRPLSSKEPQGRFIARYDGFVEPLELPIGRSLTVLGMLGKPVSGKVGETIYLYPQIRVAQAHLWRLQDLPQPLRFSFGVGINLGN